MATPTIKASGNIAIVWGTIGGLNAANNQHMPAGMIVETLTVTPKNADPIDIEDGDGFAALQVGCKDGWNGKATAVYDANKVLPAEGSTIVVVVPNQGNAGTTNANATFWSWGFTKSRKKEKMIELSFTNRPLING
jgi:hypothetical protein